MTAKSAIFVDFDNVFSTLWDLDKEAAERFASEPGDWLQSLTSAHLNDAPRRWLVARCYLNPNGYVNAPGEQRDRRYFSGYRVGLVHAGFDVVDCPPLARGGKNAADIRIVIDAMSLLEHRSRFDEFVIASGDSDFTPLLQRLRTEDRRTTIVSPGFLAAAYAASADRVVDYDALQRILRAATATIEAVPPKAPVEHDGDGKPDDRHGRFAELVQRRYSEASRPLPLAALALEIDRAVPEARAGAWFGRGSFSKALMSLDLMNARFSSHHMWDDDRHQPPSSTSDKTAELPSAVALLVRGLDLPRIGRDDWPKVFEAISTYAASHDFNLTEASRWCRDWLSDRGLHIARIAIGYVIRGVQIGGLSLSQDTAVTPEQVGDAFLTSVLDRASSSSIPLDAEAESTIRNWFGK